MVRPVRVCGGQESGGLRLPVAQASRRNLYVPRGVTIWGDDLIVCDTGNHRVLFYRDFLTRRQLQADLVLGQPDFDSEHPSNPDARHGLFMPTDAQVVEDWLIIADSWNHRLVGYRLRDLGRNDCELALVIGQPNPGVVDANQGNQVCDDRSLYWPFGFAVLADGFYVADAGNRRVLRWRDWQSATREPAELVLGQDDPSHREDNRGRLGGDSFRWPHAIDGEGDVIFIADPGNHRVLGFREPHVDREADIVIGQPSCMENSEWPYAPQGPDRLRFPYGISVDAHRLAIADSANNRVLVFDSLPTGCGEKAQRVLGQPDFEAYGENRWDVLADNTLCWPYGVDMVDDIIAIADTGNNRIVIWTLED